MRILVIGSGGREHALAWRLAREGVDVGLAPGSAGSAQHAWCVPASSIDDYAAAATEYDVDLTVVGPEAPLVAGIADRFRVEKLAIVGPTAAAAEIEGSKSFSKSFMLRNGIPTARFITVESASDARAALDSFGLPVVLKADGLAAGKGVIVARTRPEAEAAISDLLSGGGRLVIEEFLAGEEVSFIVLSDGKHFVSLPTSQDHKALYDGDQGPNTGGMGAYSDDRILSRQQIAEVEETIIARTLDCMRREGREFTGFLYAGLMLTTGGPRVLEFNARLGDPEAQSLLHRLGGDLSATLAAAAQGELGSHRLEWTSEPSVTVVLASNGYPAKPRTGDRIEGIPECERTGAMVFHAGTREEQGGFVTAGGRVLGVTAGGADLGEAISNAYAGAARIHFDGMQYRKDIGHKGLERYNRSKAGT